MLRYTGHPFVDVGLATILAYVGKKEPPELTDDDLEAVATYISRQYGKNPMRSFLSVIFPNSGFTQPAFDKVPEKRAQYANRVLRSHHQATPTLSDACVFFETPAVMRAMRETIPLIGSEGGYNFYPDAVPGLPVSGLALLCIQAFPLGCAKCSGRVLLIHSDAPDLTFAFARRFLERNLRYLGLVEQQGGADKYADAKFARTQLVAALMEVELERSDQGRPTSVTAYHLSNYGTNAVVDIYHLPLQITDFLRSAVGMHRVAWGELERRGWEGDAQERDELDLPARRNVLYEDLLVLPREASRFLRTYLLRVPRISTLGKTDPRRAYSLQREVELVNWGLTALFLRKVMGMEKGRIETIRAVGERLADYVRRENDRRLFDRLFRAERYDHLRAALIQASSIAVRQGEAPLIDFDDFVTIFEDGEDLARTDWRLARDLVLIRLIDELHRREWFAANADALATVTADADEGTADT